MYWLRQHTMIGATIIVMILATTTLVAASASAGPVSLTDCSLGFGHTWHVAGGRTGNKQKAEGKTSNFSPGQMGYSAQTGWVDCDTRTHQAYIYYRPAGVGNWIYLGGDLAYYGGTARVTDTKPCGFAYYCVQYKTEHIESGWHWYEWTS